MPFGIQFSDAQIGSNISYLDVNLYLDSNGQVQYKLYRKETDARHYLNPSSFHPNNVFDSVIFSQMLRVIDRNSRDETCVTDLQELKQDLIRCGHNENKLEEIEPLAVQRSIENKININNGANKKSNTGQALVFTTKFFKEVNQLKSLVRSVEGDIKHLCGEIRLIFALKKHHSIANKVVKNRKLSEGLQHPNSSDLKLTQSCGASRCMMCPLLFRLDENIVINGQKLFLDRNLNCKDKNIIYIETIYY